MTATTMASLVGTDLGAHTVRYDERDAILHALTIGASPDDLSLVYERDLQVLPSLLFGLGLWAVERAGALGVYDPTTTLHASQSLDVHGPLACSGTIEMSGRVRSVWDKGRAAVLDIEVTSPHATATYAIYVPGAGGFGGERGPSSAGPDHDSPSVGTGTFQTTADQAVLYRLTGDLHPVHVDPVVAAEGGFERPILHGLCTLGIALRSVAEVVGVHPATLATTTARFTAPVLPGQRLDTDVWADGDVFSFRTRADGGDVLVGHRTTFFST